MTPPERLVLLLLFGALAADPSTSAAAAADVATDDANATEGTCLLLEGVSEGRSSCRAPTDGTAGGEYPSEHRGDELGVEDWSEWEEEEDEEEGEEEDGEEEDGDDIDYEDISSSVDDKVISIPKYLTQPTSKGASDEDDTAREEEEDWDEGDPEEEEDERDEEAAAQDGSGREDRDEDEAEEEDEEDSEDWSDYEDPEYLAQFSAEELKLLDDVEEYGQPQYIEANKTETLAVVRRTLDYMEHVWGPNATHGMSEEVLELCGNRDELCAYWAAVGRCESDAAEMTRKCSPSCRTCEELGELHGEEGSEEEGSEDWSDYQDPKYLAQFSAEELKLLDAVWEYGERQYVEGNKTETMEVVRRTIDYMENDVRGPNATHNVSEEVLDGCTNGAELCAYWAALGNCESNAGFMTKKCAPSCRSCEALGAPDPKCPPLGDDVRPALLPGELNELFERVVRSAPGNRTDDVDAKGDERTTNYTAHVLSRPGPSEYGPRAFGEEYDTTADYEQPPWVVMFDDFLTAEECERLIELGYEGRYKRSKDVGELNPDGSWEGVLSEGRTSTNSWCMAKCQNDPVVKRVQERIAAVTGIPRHNSEALQMLRYQPGQFYVPHHDYVEHEWDRRGGPRVLTFFLYLNDVEEGGSTYFTELEIGVKPKVGRALLWPSVLNSDPYDRDWRTEHEAQEVIKGMKYGANAWLHLHNWTSAKEMGCIR